MRKALSAGITGKSAYSEAAVSITNLKESSGLLVRIVVATDGEFVGIKVNKGACTDTTNNFYLVSVSVVRQ